MKVKLNFRMLYKPLIGSLQVCKYYKYTYYSNTYKHKCKAFFKGLFQCLFQITKDEKTRYHKLHKVYSYGYIRKIRILFLELYFNNFKDKKHKCISLSNEGHLLIEECSFQNNLTEDFNFQ